MKTPLDLRDVSKEELFSMVDHLFVPRKVSLVCGTRAEKRLAECLVRFTEDIGLTKLSGMLENLHKFHSSPPDSGTILQHLSEPDFILAVPLLDHNAVLLFESCPEPDEVLVSALDVLPHPSAIANVMEETAVLAVPRCVVPGSLRQVRSLAFLEQLSQLGKEWSFPGKDPEARKAGHSVIETRLPAKPIYVFDWLMATLEHVPSRAKHQVIYKTVRMDMIRANLKMGPWNRSDLWVAMKSSLHVSLVSTMGIQNGTRKYKETMALFAAAMVGSIRERNVQTQAFDYGQMREMCAKIARKAKKFEQRFPEDSVNVTAATRGTCEAADKDMKASWASFVEDYKTKNFVDVKSLCQLKFAEDDVNPLTGAKQAIQSALPTNELLEKMRLDKRGTFSPSSSTALVRNEELFSAEHTVQQIIEILNTQLKASGSGMFERERALHAVELFVRTYLWPNKTTQQMLNESFARSCYKLMCAYHECAEQAWNDPVEKSRLVLYMFTFGAVLDAISVSWDPLQQLKMHKLPFIEAERLWSLLLRHHEEIVLLEELLRYVESRNEKTLLPGILSVEHFSFSDVYARKDETMIGGTCKI